MITVLAEDGPVSFDFEDVQRYHGHAALAMLAITFRALEAAFARLPAPPRRDMISVVSGHPGPGVRDAFEMVTRCVTRNAYTIDPGLAGPKLNPRGNAIYAFAISVGDHRQHVALRDNVLPAEFFALLGATTEAERRAGFDLRARIAADVLRRPEAELFTLSPA